MKHFSFALIFYLLLSLPSFAQVQINWPEDGLVFQRNKPSSATTRIYFVIASTNSTAISSVGVSFKLYDKNGGLSGLVNPGTRTTAFLPATLAITEGLGGCKVKGYIDVLGGMYQIQANINGSAYSSAQDLGVGEVLAIAGQSNAAGFSKVSTNTLGNAYPKVVRYNNKKEYFETNDPGSGAPGVGSKDFLWFWGRLGEKLVDHFVGKEGVAIPVSFYQAAWSNSKATHWSRTSYGLPSGHFTQPGAPFVNLQKIIDVNSPDSYINKVGLRGVLWLQGESDKRDQTLNYDAQLDSLVKRSRNYWSHQDLAWVISRTSYYGGGVDVANPPTRPATVPQAQERVIGPKPGSTTVVKDYGDPFGNTSISEAQAKRYAYTGPNTDLYGSADRLPVADDPDRTHLNTSGQAKVANDWATALTTPYASSTFFESSVPRIYNASTVVFSGDICEELKPCNCGFTLEGASQVTGQYKVNFIFNSCNAAKLRWYIYSGSNTSGTLIATDTLSPTSGSINVNVPTTMATGTYTIQVKALNCIGSSQWTFNYSKPGGVNPPQTCNEIPTKNSGNESEYADYSVTPSSTGSYNIRLTYASGEADPAGKVTAAGSTTNFTLSNTSGWTPSLTTTIATRTLTGGTPYTIRVAGMNGPPSHTFTHNKVCIECTNCRMGVEEVQVTAKPEVNESKVFTVFPNPTSGSIKVKYYTEDERSVTIKLFDVSGRVLKEVKAQSIKGINESEFDITDLSDAPYILNLNDGVKEHSKQIIKIK